MLILVMMLHEHAIATNFESLFFALTVTGIVTKIVTNRKKERQTLGAYNYQNFVQGLGFALKAISCTTKAKLWRIAR